MRELKASVKLMFLASFKKRVNTYFLRLGTGQLEAPIINPNLFEVSNFCFKIVMSWYMNYIPIRLFAEN